jgi:hypothetical protein
MERRILTICIFFVCCIPFYGVTLPTESYTSPYATTSKTSIYGFGLVTAPSSNLPSSTNSLNSGGTTTPIGGSDGTWAYCPYCAGIFGYGPADNFMYFACLEDPVGVTGSPCTYADCEVHGSGRAISLPITNGILPLLLFACMYAFVTYRKLRTIKE